MPIINQCDGCRRGLPTDGSGNHRSDNACDLQRCTADRYVLAPDTMVDVFQPGPVEHWATGYRFVRYEDSRTCIVMRGTGTLAGVESRWNVEAVRHATPTVERIETRAKIDGRAWRTRNGKPGTPADHILRNHFSMSRDQGYLGDVASNPNALSIYSRAFIGAAEEK